MPNCKYPKHRGLGVTCWHRKDRDKELSLSWSLSGTLTNPCLAALLFFLSLETQKNFTPRILQGFSHLSVTSPAARAAAHEMGTLERAQRHPQTTKQSALIRKHSFNPPPHHHLPALGLWANWIISIPWHLTTDDWIVLRYSLLNGKHPLRWEKSFLKCTFKRNRC